MSKGSVDLCIPIIGRFIMIWDEVFFKLRVYFDGLVIRKKVLLGSSPYIETHLVVVVEFFEFYNSAAFKVCLDD